MKQEIITEDGEIIDRVPQLIDTSGLSAIVRAEIDAQIVTARQFPRAIQRVIGNITTLATLDEETAAESLYALVRKKKQKSQNAQANDVENKPIEGPSIRLAEIAAQCYGNCRIEARTISINKAEKYVEAEGIFHDLETNMASKATVRRRISTSSGYLFSEDMILVTANAACAIAKRNAILSGIPRGVYRPAYSAARKIVAGTAETLSVNRDKALKAFSSFGVTPDQIFEAIGVEGEREINTDHIATLRAMFMTLKNGEGTVEEMFSTKTASDHQKIDDPLSDKPLLGQGDASTEKQTDTATKRNEAVSGQAEQNTNTSDLAPADVGTGTEAISENAGSTNTAEQADQSGDTSATSTDESPDSTDHEFDEAEWLKSFAKRVVAAIGEDVDQLNDVISAELVSDLTEDTETRAGAIVRLAQNACGDADNKANYVKMIAGKARVEEKDLV